MNTVEGSLQQCIPGMLGIGTLSIHKVQVQFIHQNFRERKKHVLIYLGTIQARGLGMLPRNYTQRGQSSQKPGTLGAGEQRWMNKVWGGGTKRERRERDGLTVP